MRFTIALLIGFSQLFLIMSCAGNANDSCDPACGEGKICSPDLQCIPEEAYDAQDSYAGDTSRDSSTTLCTDKDSDGFSGTGTGCNPRSADFDCDDLNPDIFPGANEQCDSIDNNCDNIIDANRDSQLTKPCYEGPAETDSIGECRPGSQVCTAGQWGVCTGQATPEPEVCDGLDNDCNGQTDDTLWTSSPAQYNFGTGSYIYELQISDSSAPCCFDINGDNNLDNKLGEVASLLTTMGYTINDDITNAIRTGDLMLLFEYHCYDETQNGSFPLVLFNGSSSTGDYWENLQGNGQFIVREDSFIPNTGEPALRFDNARLSDQNLTAGPGSFPLGFLNLMGPAMSDDLIINARIEGTPVTTETGLSLLNGRLGGSIPLATLLRQLNIYFTDQCSCLGFQGDMISWNIISGTYVVECQNISQSDTCSDQQCSFLGGQCEALLDLINQPDVDSDWDGILDSLSVGIVFNAAAASIISVE